MGIKRFEETKTEMHSRMVDATFYQRGPRTGEIKEPAHEVKREVEVIDRYSYGITYANGQENEILGYRFDKPSTAIKFYAWFYNGAKLEKDVEEWLEDIDQKEKEKSERAKGCTIY